MSRLSKKPRSHGVDPSPTPMMPTAGDSSSVISMPLLMNALAKIIAPIHPDDPPPWLTIFLITGGGADTLPMAGFLYSTYEKVCSGWFLLHFWMAGVLV